MLNYVTMKCAIHCVGDNCKTRLEVEACFDSFLAGSSLGLEISQVPGEYVLLRVDEKDMRKAGWKKDSWEGWLCPNCFKEKERRRVEREKKRSRDHAPA